MFDTRLGVLIGVLKGVLLGVVAWPLLAGRLRACVPAGPRWQGL